jgi:HD superfamily phosphohydrolase/CRP-like cAMP-binding protein
MRRRPESDGDSGRVIRDPIYGYVELPGSLAPLVDHPLYQRLRHVGQTSLTSAVYPAATGTRFEHGLGTMHLARRSWRALWGYATPQVSEAFQAAVGADIDIPADQFNQVMEDALGGAGLLHDLGHPPFSHVLEPAFRQLAWRWFEADRADPDSVTQDPQDPVQRLFSTQRAFHELVGEMLLEQLLDRTKGQVEELLRELISMILTAPLSKGTWASALHGVIDGEIDVDRLDYLMRDASRAGTEFGSIDWERLVDALELHSTREGEFLIAPGARARSAVETVLLQRTQSYKWITFHPRVVGMNLALGRAVELLIDGSRATEDPMPELPGVTPPPFPDLNYIVPGERAVISVIPSSVAGRDSLARELVHGNASSLLQAAVDDGRMLEHLKRASLECRARLLRSSDLQHEEVQRLKRLRAYLDTVLVRRKNFVPAWKTVEEFRGVVARLLEGDLVGQVGDAFEDLKKQFAADQTALQWLETRQEANLTRLEEGDIPVAGVNHLLRLLVADRAGQQQLCRLLAEQPDLPEGFWEVEFIEFRSVRNRGNLAVLFDGPKPVRLIDTSPLVKALQGVDEGGTSLFAYFFVTGEEGLYAWKDYRLGLARDRLRGAFVQAFPQFVHMGLKRLLEDFLGNDPRGEG